MNRSEKVKLILIFGECNRSSRQAARYSGIRIIRVYADRYSDRFHPHHNYVYRLLRGLNENGQFPSNQNRQRQPRPNNFEEDTEFQVMAYIRAYPRSLIRHVSRQIGVSGGAVHKILKKKTKCIRINLSLSNIYESKIINVDYNFCHGLALNSKSTIYFIIVFCELINLNSQTMV
jgi:hypothetical protein